MIIIITFSYIENINIKIAIIRQTSKTLFKHFYHGPLCSNPNIFDKTDELELGVGGEIQLPMPFKSSIPYTVLHSRQRPVTRKQS